MIKKLTWDIYFKLVCGISALVLLIAIILKLFTINCEAIELKYLFLGFGLSVILPYLSQLDAFGVKFELKKKVEDLSEQVAALPDYVLGNEYYDEDDLVLAEKYYNSSLKKCNDFWPAILGLANIYEDREIYDMAITEYYRVLSLDQDNAYALNNLAEVYIYAPSPYYNPNKAIKKLNRLLEVVPNLNSALYYKGEALNRIDSYADGYDLLKKLLDSDSFPKASHDIRYELAIAKSNMGKSFSEEELDQMLACARENDEGKELIARLKDKEELLRFNPNDISLIERFLKKNKDYQGK